ncbi:acyltransferase [Superficieibacter sp. 1612_C1]|uniref:acyltransferase n=1 Tax=Superficieibacter sp. 1612_C1 TaxID=2780382 RepID=UPI00188453D3|nr:acyltransferase [Superficieibacter sp. 1612_C1]
MKNKISGREKLNRWNWLINILSSIVAVFPHGLCNIMFNLISGMPTILGTLFRYVLIRRLAAKSGKNIYIGRWCTFKNIGKLDLGNNISFHEYCYIDAIGGIKIGDNVSIAHSVSILSFDHSFVKSDIPFKYQALSTEKITVGDNVWVGCGVRILSGTTTDNNVVIAANAVIKGMVSSGLYAGVPATKKRDL